LIIFVVADLFNIVVFLVVTAAHTKAFASQANFSADHRLILKHRILQHSSKKKSSFSHGFFFPHSLERSLASQWVLPIAKPQGLDQWEKLILRKYLVLRLLLGVED